MKKFKGMLLACDMDGTLLDDSKQIPAETLRALQYCTKQGGRLSLATGRSPHAIGIYIDQLPVNAPYSVMNGSLICDENRKILYCSGMPYETKEMIEHVLLNNSQFGCEVFTAETAITRCSTCTSCIWIIRCFLMSSLQKAQLRTGVRSILPVNRHKSPHLHRIY